MCYNELGLIFCNAHMSSEISADLRTIAIGNTSCVRAAARNQAVERLFREHNEALLRFLAVRLGSRQMAHEVAQEAYVRLLSLDEPGAISFLRSFLFKTAANLAIDRVRRGLVHERARRQPLFAELTDARTPERQVESAQLIERVKRLVGELPPKCRQAFVLNRFYGMEFRDVAVHLQLSERMVRTYVVRALLYCTARLDDAPAAPGTSR